MLNVHVYQDARGEFRWRAVRGGNIVADSGESYTRRSDARRAVTRLMHTPWAHVLIDDERWKGQRRTTP